MAAQATRKSQRGGSLNALGNFWSRGLGVGVLPFDRQGSIGRLVRAKIGEEGASNCISESQTLGVTLDIDAECVPVSQLKAACMVYVYAGGWQAVSDRQPTGSSRAKFGVFAASTLEIVCDFRDKKIVRNSGKRAK